VLSSLGWAVLAAVAAFTIFRFLFAPLSFPHGGRALRVHPNGKRLPCMVKLRQFSNFVSLLVKRFVQRVQFFRKACQILFPALKRELDSRVPSFPKSSFVFRVARV